MVEFPMLSIASVMTDYFSGRMRQRIMIAMAMSCNPKLLIVSEATTALDVTTQAQVSEVIA